DAWLEWQQNLHPKHIELGLERVREVFQRMPLERVAQRVITVAGTNGKGSTVAYYESWFRHQGIRVASYTSPHVLRYNERIRLDGQPVSDQQLCQAFDVVDQARAGSALTYFEFGTLAALYLISRHAPEVAVLEVGLGGRLDAVNIIDPDLAHITPIGLDHQDWLGDDRDSIALEKAGILRQHGLSVINDADPPPSLLAELQRLDCDYRLIGRDYHYHWLDRQRIEWQGRQQVLQLQPPLAGEHQAHNLTGVVAGLDLLGYLSAAAADISANFSDAYCSGRLQQLETDAGARLWLDVGHNEDAAVALADFFSQEKGSRRLIVILGMLADKNIEAFVAALNPVVDEWWLLGLDGERGLSAQGLARRVSGVIDAAQQFEQIDDAIKQALLSLNNQDILLITGSFLTVEAALSSPVLSSTSSWINI
ncbi:MAG: folylpolyglutamate synthase/dihydrofolate synthase family protein, partial [Gammaproteobacteria bacterium]|nr:folylpolyglutamate synthase/dihydrofolate synthase family protein [Gammaproteobacteria bacterium]